MPLSPSIAAHARAFDRWLRQDALPLWSGAGFDGETRTFQGALGADGAALPLPRRLRVQARQTWVFAQAGLMDWEGPWRDRVSAGLEALERRYRKADGGYRTLVAADGVVMDEQDTLYDQAFVLLALAGVTAAGVADQSGPAQALLTSAIARLKHPGGGYRETKGETPFQSNPLMHLFEAALAWELVAPSAPWAPLADSLAELALTRFFDGKHMREFFDHAWRPVPGPSGALVDPGHQFEWAWLLERWGVARSRQDARDAAARLWLSGEGLVDRRRGVAADMMPLGDRPEDHAARLWPQTERLKASLILAERGDSEHGVYVAGAESASAAIAGYLEGAAPGLWHERMAAGGGFTDEPAPATSFYHLVGAILELQAARR